MELALLELALAQLLEPETGFERISFRMTEIFTGVTAVMRYISKGEAFRQITYWLYAEVNYRNASPLHPYLKCTPLQRELLYDAVSLQKFSP